jgi:acetyl-CoA carboxylase carboxyltransferase component
MSMVYPIKGTAPRERRVPLITAIMGECFGGSAWTASISDIVIQVKGTSMCVGGPSILEIATGEKASTEELGGWKLHATQTGQVDLFAENDEDCLALVRKVLGYFPDNCNEFPPISSPLPSRERGGGEGLLDLVPSDPKLVYDMHRVLDAIFDPGSILELKPFYDGSLITALARLEGHVVGVLANNPKVTAGAMGPGACEKAVSFICLCDSFHIPLVFLHDTPGFFVGKRAEEGAMPLRIMNWIEALHQSSVPRVSVIIRKSYGMAHCGRLLHGPRGGGERRLRPQVAGDPPSPTGREPGRGLFIFPSPVPGEGQGRGCFDPRRTDGADLPRQRALARRRSQLHRPRHRPA